MAYILIKYWNSFNSPSVEFLEAFLEDEKANERVLELVGNYADESNQDYQLVDDAFVEETGFAREIDLEGNIVVEYAIGDGIENFVYAIVEIQLRGERTRRFSAVTSHSPEELVDIEEILQNDQFTGRFGRWINIKTDHQSEWFKVGSDDYIARILDNPNSPVRTADTFSDEEMMRLQGSSSRAPSPVFSGPRSREGSRVRSTKSEPEPIPFLGTSKGKEKAEFPAPKNKKTAEPQISSKLIIRRRE